MSNDNGVNEESLPGNFRCRRCRFSLFRKTDLNSNHKDTIECSSWYLDDGALLPWVEDLINQSGWTTGKLYCPKCQARVGGFDFVHVIQCTCSSDIIPAIWCKKGKIDMPRKIELPGYRSTKDDGSNNEKYENHNQNNVRGLPNANQQQNSLDGNVSSGGSLSPSSSQLNFFKAEQELTIGEDLGGKIQHIEGSSTTGRFLRHPTRLKCGQLSCSGGGEDLPLTVCQDISTERCACKYSKNTNTTEVSHSKGHFSHSYKSARGGVVYCKSCINNSRTADLMCGSPPKRLQGTIDGRVMCGNHLHKDLEEIREEIVHLYNKVMEKDMELVTTRRNKRKRRLKRTTRRQNSRFSGQEDDVFYECMARVPRKKAGDVFGSQGMEGSSPERRVIPDEHQCSVCLELLIDPHATPCEHTFCAFCLRQLNHVSERRPTCPLCRAPVTAVTPQRELKSELVQKYPKIYKKREGEIRVLPQTRWPLPSPATTRFQTQQPDDGNVHNGFMWLLHSFGVAILITVITVVFGLFGDERNHRSIIHLRNSTLFKLFKLLMILTAVCSCVAVGVMLAAIVIYAFDFVKFASFIILCYVIVMKLMIVVVSN